MGKARIEKTSPKDARGLGSDETGGGGGGGSCKQPAVPPLPSFLQIPRVQLSGVPSNFGPFLLSDQRVNTIYQHSRNVSINRLKPF